MQFRYIFVIRHDKILKKYHHLFDVFLSGIVKLGWLQGCNDSPFPTVTISFVSATSSISYRYFLYELRHHYPSMAIYISPLFIQVVFHDFRLVSDAQGKLDSTFCYLFSDAFDNCVMLLMLYITLQLSFVPLPLVYIVL